MVSGRKAAQTGHSIGREFVREKSLTQVKHPLRALVSRSVALMIPV